jgi:hypothetical protein
MPDSGALRASADAAAADANHTAMAVIWANRMTTIERHLPESPPTHAGAPGSESAVFTHRSAV